MESKNPIACFPKYDNQNVVFNASQRFLERNNTLVAQVPSHRAQRCGCRCVASSADGRVADGRSGGEFDVSVQGAVLSKTPPSALEAADF